MFFITFIIATDFSLSATEKVRDDVLPLSYGQELELKKQEVEEDNNTESLQNETSSPAEGVNNKVQGTLIVTKKVINEGGENSKQPSDFTIKIRCCQPPRTKWFSFNSHRNFLQAPNINFWFIRFDEPHQWAELTSTPTIQRQDMHNSSLVA